jgi:competence protein ComEA
MEGFLNIKEKILRIRFFIEKLKYKRERHFYLAVFLLAGTLCMISVSIYLYQRNQVIVRENIISSYYDSFAIKDGNAPETDSIDAEGENTDKNTEIKSADKIKVYICGYVNNPGVYEIDEGSRLVDLIKLCGGTDQKAALEAVNLASVLTDESMIYIPSVDEIMEEKISGKKGGVSIISEGDGFMININTATLEELVLLPGIGEKTAAAIIEYRNNFGLFKSIEGLKNVKGIGDKKFEAVKDKISI